MSAVEPFDFAGQQVRVVTDESGEPWFVAADIARTLGYSATAAMTRSLDDDERGVRSLHTPSGDQDFTTVSEAGLFSAILRSRVPEARDFKRWVTHEVLPAIRRTGAYAVPQQPMSRLELIDMARDAEVARIAAEEKVAQLRPSATAWDNLAAATGDYSMRDAAQVLCRDHGINIGQNRLSAYLRDAGWVDGKGIPYQRRLDAGLLRAKPRSYYDSRTKERVLAEPQIRVTVKGIAALRDLLAPAGTTLALVDRGVPA